MPPQKSPKWMLVLSLVVLLGAKTSEREKRVALVIGNGAYLGMTRLTNPPQDAKDVGRKLESLGFDVIALENQGRAAMERAVEEFAKRSHGANVAVLYYSGHGIQIDGRNYLIPVDAEPPGDEAEMHRQAVELEWVVGRTTRVAKVSLVFMDACRNNPGLDRKLPGSGRDGTRDVRLLAVPKGTVQVLYAASRGQRALDSVGSADKKSRNSPFAEALLDHLGDRDAVQVVATKVIGQVKNRTEHQQLPELQGNLDELLYLAGKSAPITCPAGMVLADGACQPVMNKTCPPGLRFAEGVGCVPNVVPGNKPDQVSAEPTVARPTAVGSDTTLEETIHRPKLVPIPKGRFLMGSPNAEKGRGDDETEHWVLLTQPYLMMETEVTQGQFQSVMGRNPSATRKTLVYLASGTETGSQDDCKDAGVSSDLPVYCVDFFDAVRYANRLSQIEGIEECYRLAGTEVRWDGCKGYRLPTEAEWEYAARAGQRSVYSGSSSAEEVGWYYGNSGSQTHSVKKKKANEWGLYDLTGNVWEWVWDWYADHDAKEQRDPVGPPKLEAGAVLRVVRGGGWSRDTEGVRVAIRARRVPNGRYQDQGFRLVRSFP